jgi:prepilin-type N-terminal cleavage/methylation domain-containing protein
MRRLRRLHQSQKGQTLVEVLVAIAIAGIMLPALATALAASREGRAQEEERVQATALLREADEAVRSVREKGWTGFAVNGTYRPAISGSTWTLTSGAETIGTFTRQVVISDVQRNSSGAIVTSGGTVDPSTKKVVGTVSWTLPLPSSVTSESYYQRHLNNTAWNQTTQAEFTAGTETNTVATATGGGQVELTNTPGGTSWATADISIADTLDAAGTTDASDVFVSGNYAYVSQGTALRIIDVTTKTNITLTGSYTAGGNINGVFVSGNYAYLATASDTAELTVVNITNKASPTLAGSLDITSTTDANMVYVDGTYAYLGRVNSTTAGVNEFVIANVTTPTAPTLSGSLNLSNTVSSVFVSGNYAYLATSISTAELTIINITNKTTPTSAGVFNASGTVAATDIFVAGTTVYLTRLNNTSGGELHILNATNPASVSEVGSYDAGINLTGVRVDGTYAFISSAIASGQFRVLNITTPSSPSTIGSLNMGATTNDIFQAGNYAYLAGTNNTAELAIVQAGTLAGGYQTSGTFESSTLDAGATVGFNYLTFGITEPASTNIQFQIATNTDNATWNYVGPDGTASTFYTAAGAIPLARVSGRYLRYRAGFTGPGTSTPVISDVSVNYSP